MEVDLVFDGCGVPALHGFAGAYSVLERKGFRIRKICGVSAGAVIGALIKDGHNAEKIKRIITLDGSRARDIIYKTISADRCNELSIIASNLTHLRTELLPGLLSKQNSIFASFHIPQEYNRGVSTDEGILADGSLLSPFPVNIFDVIDPEIPTFGITMDYSNFYPSLSGWYIELLIKRRSLEHIPTKNSARTITITNTGLSPIEDRLLQVQEEALWAAGADAAEVFLGNWNFKVFKERYCKDGL